MAAGKGLNRKGFTLIEMMIVVALMAGLLTVSAFGMGMIGRADVRGEATRFSSAVRYVFNMAASSNRTLQMKINFETHEFTVEELELSGGLSDDELRGVTMKNKDTNRWRTSSRASNLDAEDSRFGNVSRTAVEDIFISGDDAKLKEGVYFIGLMTPHHDDIQTEGIGTINFFANGFVERSIIYLGDEKALNDEPEATFYTVTVSPLTGNSSVVAGRSEYSSSFFDEEEDD